MTDAELCLKEIGQRIMDRRKKLGLTQEALAEKGDVTAQLSLTPRRGNERCAPRIS